MIVEDFDEARHVRALHMVRQALGHVEGRNGVLVQGRGVGGKIRGLANKADLRVNVLRDRAILSREVAGGLIENVYRLQVMNVTEQAHRYTVSVSGLADIKLEGESSIEVPPVTSKSFALSVRVPLESGKPGAHPIYFDVKAATNDKMAVHEKATFLIP